MSKPVTQISALHPGTSEQDLLSQLRVICKKLLAESGWAIAEDVQFTKEETEEIAKYRAELWAIWKSIKDGKSKKADEIEIPDKPKFL